MSSRKVLALLVLTSMLLTTPLAPFVTAAPPVSRGPLSAPVLPALNYTWENRETVWNWWANSSSPGDKDHLFFVYDNKVMVLDIASNTTKEVANITYKKVTDPNGPDHNSTLYDIKATVLDDGRYHLGMLENQYENNQTAKYLLIMLVDRDGTLIKWARPIGNWTVAGWDIEKALCYAEIRNGTAYQAYMVWWNKTGNDDWYPFSFGGGGQGAPLFKYLVTISYNESDGFYTVLYLPQGSSCIDVIWLSITGGGHGIGGYYSCVNQDWGIMAIDSSFDMDNGLNNLSVAVMEENLYDNRHRVEYIGNQGEYYPGPHWEGDIYDQGVLLMVPYYNQYTNIAISAGEGVICIMYPTIPLGGGGPSVPSFITALFLDEEGTLLGNATFHRLEDGPIGTLMVGHSFYVGGERMTSNGAQPPTYSLFIDKVTPHFFGDWGLSDLHVVPPKDMYSVNETLSLIVQPRSDPYPLGQSWMEPCNVNFSVDGVRISTMQWPLYPSSQLQSLHMDWTATLGTHNITANLEVPQDVNWTNNMISITIKVGLPDLAVTNLTVAPPVITPGMAILVNFSLENLGPDLSSAKLEIDLGTTSLWTEELQNITNGYDLGLNQTIATSNFTHGTFNLTVRALPLNSSDSNWSNNQLTVVLRVYNPRIDLFVDTPKEQDPVAKTLIVKGHVKDPENETVSVWAFLKAGFYSNSTPVNKTKGAFELEMDLSKVFMGDYILIVHANGTLGRSTQRTVNISVRNGPYWSLLVPNTNASTMRENSSMNFTAFAYDWGTDKPVKVNWTLDGNDALGLKGVQVKDGTLTYSPGYDDPGSHTIRAVAFNIFGKITHTWMINVTEVNRPPVITNVTPTGTVKIVLGGSQSFSVRAMDLNYTWVDGNWTAYGLSINYKPVAPGNSTMFLYVSDGRVSTVYKWSVVVVTKGKPPIIPPPPVKTHTTVQSPWIPWAILVVIVGIIAGLAGYYYRTAPPKKKGPPKTLKGSDK